MKKILLGFCKIPCARLLRQLSGSRVTSTLSCHRFTTWLPVATENKDQSGISIKYPGYSYDDLDRHGNVSIHKVSALAEATNMSAREPSDLPSAPDVGYRSVMRRLYDDRLIVVLTTNSDIMPEFYDEKHLYNPVVSVDNTINIGKTSFQFQTMIKSEKTGQVLHTGIFQMVVVDKVSRQPTPLPEFFVEHFKSRNIQVPFERIRLLEKPHRTKTGQYVVRWSDTDKHFHLNQANYIRICFDTLEEVSRAGFFSILTGDLGRYRVKNYKCYYQNEAVPGDVLDIHMWENLANPMIVHAIAERDGTSIFQVSFEFK